MCVNASGASRGFPRRGMEAPTGEGRGPTSELMRTALRVRRISFDMRMRVDCTAAVLALQNSFVMCGLHYWTFDQSGVHAASKCPPVAHE